MNESSRAKPQPYLYVPSFAAAPSRTEQQQSQSGGGRRQKHQSASTGSQLKFLIDEPKSFIINEEKGDDWTLRCICQIDTTAGLLVACEKCGCWQHAICVGLNGHTLPNQYLCEFCGNRPIRCKCGNNSNYLFSIIQCSHCGYYVHRRCNGLHFGPLPPGEFICNYCGKSKLTFPKIKISNRLKLDNNVSYTFTQDKFENMPNGIFNGPINDFLSIDIDEATLDYREFFECFYDRFRSFFFICHPLNNSSISKKKRHGLFTSFFSAALYLSNYFYGITPEQAKEIFDDLLFNDIFRTNVNMKPKEEFGCTFTENTSLELERKDDIMKFHSMPEEQHFEIRENGVFACENLKSGQFLLLTDGLVGDLEEFNYDNGVDYRFYQISGTRFILDTTYIKNSMLHKMRRSLNGNCVLRLFKVGNVTYCGCFVGQAELDQLFPSDVCIKAGEELKLGIDFMPGVLEDISKWVGWQFTDIESHTDKKPSREEREIVQTETQQAEPRRTKSQKSKKKDQSSSKKRGRKVKKGSEQQSLSSEFSLFDLFDSESPCSYMFTVTEDVEKYHQMLKEQQLQRQNEIPVKKAKTETKHRQNVKPEVTKPKPTEKKAVHTAEKVREPDAFQLTEEIESYLHETEIPLYIPLIKNNPIEQMKELLKINV